MSQSMGNILNLPIPAVPVRLAAVAAFAVTLTDRRKGSPARADPYPGRENSAAGNFGLRARRGIFWYFPCKLIRKIRWCQSTDDKDKGYPKEIRTGAPTSLKFIEKAQRGAY